MDKAIGAGSKGDGRMWSMRHKYKAQRTDRDGVSFASKAEARYFDYLQIMQRQGRVLFFLRQVPFHLPGGVKYVVDFVEFWAPSNDEPGEVKFVDVKGMETESFIMKKKMVEELYPIKIDVVKNDRK
jgi:hypothetical protein